MEANETIDQLTLRVGSGLALVVLAWLMLGVGAGLVVRIARRRGRAPQFAEALARRTLPRWAYALVAGSAVVLTPLAAHAAPPSPSLPPPSLPISTAHPVAMPSATSPVAPASPPAAQEPPRHATVVVRPGDSLWRLAREHVAAAHPTDRQVAAAWPRWYAANRAVIGTDPDLIHPGARLRVPEDAS
jgi:nucleoid-associated protein YgaU